MSSRWRSPIGSGVPRITSARTWQGWLYLAAVMDLYSRGIVGWSMKPTLARELGLDALLMAVWCRRPSARVLVHFDLRCQYGSEDWLRFCQTNNLEKHIYRTRDLAKATVFDHIEVFYNRTRRHSHLGGVSPEAFERA